MSKILINGNSIEFDENQNRDLTTKNTIIPETSRIVQNVVQPTELGESLIELNKDRIDDETRMSGIDLRSRLYSSEISFILGLDALVALGVCPTKCLAFTRQKKRLSVSLMGKGRSEIVDVVAGKREMDSKKGFVDGVKNWFGGGKQ